MRVKKINNTVGFSLVEAMIGMMIVAIIMVGAFGAMAQGSNFYLLQNIQIELRQELRNVMDLMVDDFQKACRSTIENTLVDTDPNVTYASIRVYPPVATGTSVSCNTANSDILYSRNSGTGNTLRTINSGARVISENITSLSFRRLETDRIDVVLNAQKGTGSGILVQDSLSFTVYTRN